MSKDIEILGFLKLNMIALFNAVWLVCETKKYEVALPFF